MIISIVIPCFNQGFFLLEALDSIKNANINYEYEIIIVNDGSTDNETNEIINSINDKKVKKIIQANTGLATARNEGIKLAQGEFILPLDADNKITPEYIEEGISILIGNLSYDIVYGKPIFFGDTLPKREFDVGEFNIVKLFAGNFIDACAIFRKKVWENVGGFDINLPFPGHEDWEFWINAYSKGFKFCFLDKPLYYYRIRKDSMISEFKKDNYQKGHKNFGYIANKHAALFSSIYFDVHIYYFIIRNDLDSPLRSIFKYLSYFFKIRKPIKPKNYFF